MATGKIPERITLRTTPETRALLAEQWAARPDLDLTGVVNLLMERAARPEFRTQYRHALLLSIARLEESLRELDRECNE